MPSENCRPTLSLKYALRKVRTHVRPLLGIDRMMMSPLERSRARLLIFHRGWRMELNLRWAPGGVQPPRKRCYWLPMRLYSFPTRGRTGFDLKFEAQTACRGW